MHGQKKKNVFRPSLLDTETNHCYHWRDEERDTNSSVRKDRRRDGDKELGDSLQIDRWMENSSTKHYEARRAPSEHWADLYLPWRSNSSQCRERGESPHHQTPTPNKQVPTFSYSQGSMENTSTISLDRGNFSSSGISMSNISFNSQYSGAISEKKRRKKQVKVVL